MSRTRGTRSQWCFSSITGGHNNVASGSYSVVSGWRRTTNRSLQLHDGARWGTNSAAYDFAALFPGGAWKCEKLQVDILPISEVHANAASGDNAPYLGGAWPYDARETTTVWIRQIDDQRSTIVDQIEINQSQIIRSSVGSRSINSGARSIIGFGYYNYIHYERCDLIINTNNTAMSIEHTHFKLRF